MNIETAKFITSEEGQTLLNELQASLPVINETNQLQILSWLRRKYEPEEAGALLEVLLLRQKAEKQGKFSKGDSMFFTRSGLEQASGETVASYQARRFAKMLPKGAKVADLACGIGGDLIALAEYSEATGVDLDPIRLEFARANLEVYGRKANLVRLDLQEFDPTGFEALFFDPGRRTAEGKRLFGVEDYQPPLSIIKKWLPLVPSVGVKIAPGVNYDELADYDCEIEIISEQGEVKESVLWFGKLRTETQRRATLLPGEYSLTSQSGKPDVSSGMPLAYLYEPDGAVIRAGLVEELALVMGNGTRKLDPDIAYLTSDIEIKTPFARSWPVLESQPWNLKKLNRRLQELGVGKVTVKKRGSPIDPQALEKALKLKGDRHLLVVLTHVMGQPYVLLCEI